MWFRLTSLYLEYDQSSNPIEKPVCLAWKMNVYLVAINFYFIFFLQANFWLWALYVCKDSDSIGFDPRNIIIKILAFDKVAWMNFIHFLGNQFSFQKQIWVGDLLTTLFVLCCVSYRLWCSALQLVHCYFWDDDCYPFAWLWFQAAYSTA